MVVIVLPPLFAEAHPLPGASGLVLIDNIRYYHEFHELFINVDFPVRLGPTTPKIDISASSFGYIMRYALRRQYFLLPLTKIRFVHTYI